MLGEMIGECTGKVAGIRVISTEGQETARSLAAGPGHFVGTGYCRLRDLSAVGAVGCGAKR